MPRRLKAKHPHSDQKRDKASSLLEVIEYIHFLQEKVHKYEGSFQEWNHDPKKLMPWRNNDKPSENFEHGGTNTESVPSPSFLFASKIDDEKNNTISPKIRRCTQNVESGLSTTTQSKGQGAENTIYQPLEECQTMMAASEKLKDKELTIEAGAISISSVYSKGLLDTLTRVLESSGVDLSQASISVQIELGKKANIKPTIPMCGVKDDEVPSNNQRMMSGQAVKKLKTCKA